MKKVEVKRTEMKFKCFCYRCAKRTPVYQVLFPLNIIKYFKTCCEGEIEL